MFLNVIKIFKNFKKRSAYNFLGKSFTIKKTKRLPIPTSYAGQRWALKSMPSEAVHAKDKGFYSGSDDFYIFK